MKIVFLLLICLFTGACNKIVGTIDPVETFTAKSYLALSSTYAVDVLESSYFNTGAPVRRPVATWKGLMRFKTLGRKAQNDIEYCLNYRVPKLNKAKLAHFGILKLVRVDLNEKCHSVFDREGSTQIKDIKDLLLFFGLEKKRIGKVQYGPLELILKFKTNKKGRHEKTERIITLPLLNLSKNKVLVEGRLEVETSSYQKKRFSSGIKLRKYPGMIFWPMENGDRFYRSKKTKLTGLGKKTDSFPDGTLVVCHKVNHKCKTVQEYSCDRCRFGWFEVVQGRKCKQGGTKFCGPNLCGAKGWPACFRGYEYVEKKKENYCYDGSKVGFCQEGMDTYCNSDKILVCL